MNMPLIPSVDENIHNTKIITEGMAKIMVEDGIFYNPKMEINRDLVSTAVGVAGAKTYCDGHSASGIKAIRVMMENACVEKVDAVDMSERACDGISENARRNNVMNINVIRDDLRSVLMNNNYDFVEIDPFGTPVPFLHSLAESFSWRKSGYFSLTATDTAVLCGAEARACRRNYGSTPLHNEFVHESGLRILIYKTQNVFAEKNIAISPLLSISHRHYLKVFFEARKDARLCDANLARMKYLLYCNKCKNRRYINIGESRKCDVCGNTAIVAGPFWSGRLHDDGFVSMMMKEIEKRGYKNAEEELKLLATLKNENFEGYCYDLHVIFKGKPIPRNDAILERLRGNGFRAELTSYRNGRIIRTDAGIKEIM